MLTFLSSYLSHHRDQTLLEVLQLLKLSFANIGLAVNMLKCKLWRPDDYSEATPALPITWSKWNDDIRDLGVPSFWDLNLSMAVSDIWNSVIIHRMW